MSRPRKPAPSKAKPHEPAPEEVAALQAMWAGHKPEPRLKLTGQSLSADHDDPLIGQALWGEALGSHRPLFVQGMLDRLARIGPAGDMTAKVGNANFALAVIAEIEPRNGIEATLAAQMAAVHMATMQAAGALSRADMLPQYEAHERALNRLARTFAAQVEALAKLRGGGKQVVEVRRYDVRGNNVVVGDVRTGGGDGGGNPAQAREPGALGFDPGQTVAALLGEDEARDAVSVAGDPGPEAVQATRRHEHGRAEG